MPRRNVRVAAGNNSSQQHLLLRRIQRLWARLARRNAANREREITIALHDLLVGSRRVRDLPLDVLAGAAALAEQRVKDARDRLNEMAAAQEPQAVADAAPAPSGGGGCFF